MAIEGAATVTTFRTDPPMTTRTFRLWIEVMTTTETVKLKAMITVCTDHRLFRVNPSYGTTLVTLQQNDGTIILNRFVNQF